MCVCVCSLAKAFSTTSYGMLFIFHKKKARSVFVNAFINELQFVFGSVPELVA